MDMKKIAILHTTPVTIALLGTLIKEKIPGAQIYHFMDDSILPMLLEDRGTLEYAYEKLLCYAQFAQRQGAQIILNACSSMGGFSEFARGKLSAALLRIDDPVSDLAVRSGKTIAVLATLPTTLEPSCALLRKKASDDIVVVPMLVEGAYQANCAGKKSEHDRLIAQAIDRAAQEYEVIYLAQASMADAAGLSKAASGKVLSSTAPAITKLAELYQRL